MVELRVDGIHENNMPQECFISVRVGETQKLSRLAAGRVYRFPEAGDRRFGKIEVFRRIGMCSVDVDLTNDAARDVTVNCQDEGFGHLNMKIGVDPSGRKDHGVGGNHAAPTSPRGAAKPEGAKVRAAKDYLNKHGLEVKLSEAMQALLRDRPENPHEYLASKLLGGNQLPPLAYAPNAKINDRSCPDGLSSQMMKQNNRLTPLPVQVMGPGYYTQHFRSMPTAALAGVHAKFPARAIAKASAGSSGGGGAPGSKSYYCANFPAMPKAAWSQVNALFPKAAGQGKAAGALKVAVKDVVPFPAYYSANVLPQSAEPCWGKIYGKFPGYVPGAEAPSSKPEETVSKMQKFTHAPSVGTWLARRLKNDGQGSSASSVQATGREKVPVKDLVPFAAYYEANVIECPRSTFDALHKKFPPAKGAPERTSVGEDKPKGPIWTQRPSIGTWLARPQGPKKVTPTFKFKPSVGSWLAPPPCDP